MQPRRPPQVNSGSTFLITVITMAVLALGAAYLLRLTGSRYRALYQADSWHQAIASAEAGADFAITTLSTSNWTNWSAPDANGVRTFNLPSLKHGGDGSDTQDVKIQVDSPWGSTSPKYYRIRSTGVAYLPAGPYSGLDGDDAALRHLSLVFDRDAAPGSQVRLTKPKVTRTVEVIARPAPTYRRPLVLTGKFTPKMSTSLIDSFDSEDPAKSTNGLYDVAKRQSNGNIIINDSTGSDLVGMSIYGTLGYAGPTIPNAQNVKGTITTPQTEKVLPVAKPTWTTVDGSFGAVTSGGTVTAGPPGSPTRYKMSSVKINTGADVNFVASTPGAGGEIELWVTGDITLAGSAHLVIEKGVKVTVWFEGNMKAAGSVATNYNGVAGSLSFNGVTPADGTPRTISMGGGSTTIASFNVPAYDVAIDGGGTFFGGFIAKTLSFNNGKGEVHYDEALGRQSGTGSEYTVASYAEDVR